MKEISGPSPKELKIAAVCRKKRLFQKVGSLQFISSSDDSSVVSVITAAMNTEKKHAAQ